MVDVDNMQGRVRKSMMRVEILGQTFGQLAGRVVIDRAQGPTQWRSCAEV
jgi:hypothetical protein